jgi:hypothetical protein
MATVQWEDLVTVDGQIIRLEIPTKYYDDCIEAINNAQARGDNWSPQMFDGCTAEYMGLGLSRINMKKVIGWL